MQYFSATVTLEAISGPPIHTLSRLQARLIRHLGRTRNSANLAQIHSRSRTKYLKKEPVLANSLATRFELFRHVEIARGCLRQVGNQVCDQLARISATSWRAGQLGSVIECGQIPLRYPAR